MDRLKRVFEIFNVLWNAAIQKDQTPQGLWLSMPEWARAYLIETLSEVPPLKEGDPKFTPARPNMKYETIHCYANDNDSSVVVTWDDNADPPLLGVTLELDLECVIAYLMPTADERKGLAPLPKLPKRIVAD
jgi:hypothetical protein